MHLLVKPFVSPLRRHGILWFASAAASIVWLAAVSSLGAADTAAERRPNVILIITDDQGYGDLGAHGNPIIQTPRLDWLHDHSARLSRFYVSPVCTPTRASLLTGRYNYRTRAIDTFRGRAMIEPDETTLAEVLRPAGYATGIFGKWHLGDCYPSRPNDQGFTEALVHRGGGIGQPSDPPDGVGKYTDPVLFHNGHPVRKTGYCTDVYFREGMAWAEKQSAEGRPFFLYLPTNAPHGPYEDVPPEWLSRYQQQGPITRDRFPNQPGQPIPEKLPSDTLARVYAMISNIDDNVGRMLDWLNRTGLQSQTLVLFLTDNGPATPGYNAGMRGRKTEVYEGGIRSPLFACWPGQLEPGVASDRVAAHLDLFPTILEVCQAPVPEKLKLDGRSVWPLLKRRPADWPERSLILQSHRGDVPVPGHNAAVIGQRWKLVRASGFGREQMPTPVPPWELFDLQADPFEFHDLAAMHPQVVNNLQKTYDAWWADVSTTRPDNFAPPRIVIGTPAELLTVLTRQDWRGGDWKPQDRGWWEVAVQNAGRYTVTLRFAPGTVGMAEFRCGAAIASQGVTAQDGVVTFQHVELAAGPARIDAAVRAADVAKGVMFVELARE